MGGSILPIVFVGEMYICSPLLLAVLVRRTVSGIVMGGTLVPEGTEAIIGEGSVVSIPGDDSRRVRVDWSPHQCWTSSNS